MKDVGQSTEQPLYPRTHIDTLFRAKYLEFNPQYFW